MEELSSCASTDTDRGLDAAILKGLAGAKLS